MPPDDDSELDQADMRRLVSGQDAGLNELMNRHGAGLFRYLVRLLQNEDDAAETAQEAFVRVYQNRGRFNPGQKFSSWLYAIATNLVKDHYRFRSRHPQVSLEAENEATGTGLRQILPDERPAPDESLQATERADAVRDAVAQLPMELRAPLILSEYEELSHSEIAAVLQCTPKAVETRIYRARKQLRDKLGWLLEP